VALEERDAPLAHPHRLDEAVARRLHLANIQTPALGRKSCLMPAHFTFCYRRKPFTGRIKHEHGSSGRFSAPLVRDDSYRPLRLHEEDQDHHRCSDLAGGDRGLWHRRRARRPTRAPPQARRVSGLDPGRAAGPPAATEIARLCRHCGCRPAWQLDPLPADGRSATRARARSGPGPRRSGRPRPRIRSRERQVRARRKSMNDTTASSKIVARRRRAIRRLATPSRTSLRDASVIRFRVTPFCLTLFVVAACSHAPPADFAPDPGLIAQVRDLRIVTAQDRACPGGWIQASYEAVLADGSRVPFARSYDKKHPPRLHVVFLERS